MAGAGVPHDQKGGVVVIPAFRNVGTPGLLTNGGKIPVLQTFFYPEIVFTRWNLRSYPGGVRFHFICLRQPGALFKKTAPGPRKNFLYIVSLSYDVSAAVPDYNRLYSLPGEGFVIFFIFVFLRALRGYFIKYISLCGSDNHSAPSLPMNTISSMVTTPCSR
jgi:hypothetical protein